MFFENTYNDNNECNSISWDKKIFVFEDIDCIGDIILSREEKNKKQNNKNPKKINNKTWNKYKNDNNKNDNNKNDNNKNYNDKNIIKVGDIIQSICNSNETQTVSILQEKQITLGDTTFKLEEPFLVVATQNPIEQEGTYPLPEAQVDRFMLKIVVGYPQLEEERMIIRQNINPSSQSKINSVVSPAEILEARNLVREVYMDEKIEKYILDIVFATREPEKYKLAKIKPMISYGASPRASINLALASKAYAFIKRRGYVIPEDVRAVCMDVMRHRVGLTYEAEAENMTSEMIVNEILNAVEVP
jgi:hypothetical protein